MPHVLPYVNLSLNHASPIFPASLEHLGVVHEGLDMQQTEKRSDEWQSRRIPVLKPALSRVASLAVGVNLAGRRFRREKAARRIRLSTQ